MIGFIPLRTEEHYLVPLVIILLVEYILMFTILYALQANGTIFKGFSEGKVFNNFINSHGAFGGGILLCVMRVLVAIMFVCVVGYHYAYQPLQMGLNPAEWVQYTQWSLLLAMFYFLIVSIMSIRKLSLNQNGGSTTSDLIDPRLTKFTSSLFSLAGNIAIVSSALSLYEHKWDVVYLDHIVLATLLMEIFLNNFSVTVSDIFHSLNFAYLYIIVLFVVVVIFDAREWPHSFFKLEDRWCIARYNIFIFSHVFLFGLFYLLCNKVAACGNTRVLPKIAPVTPTPKPDEEQNKTTERPDMLRSSDRFSSDDHHPPLLEEEADEEGDIENPKSKRPTRHIKTIDEQLEEQYCPENKNTYGDPPPPGAGDLTEDEEKELKHNVGKLSYQLDKQAEKIDKLKHQSDEKDIKMKQLEADLEARDSRLAMLVSQQKEILDQRITTPVEVFEPTPKITSTPTPVVPEVKPISGVVSCPGCEKDYRVNDDMTLVEVEDVEEVQQKAAKVPIITEPFITEQLDKDYFRHVLLSELIKDSRQRAKKLGLSIYYNKDIDKGKDKTFKLKKDLQNEIYLVCTGDLLYPSRHPETLKEEKRKILLEVTEDDFALFHSSPNQKKEQPPLPESNPVEKPRKIVFYRQKSILRDTLRQESIDEIRERADELDIDIYDENGLLKLKKNLKAEIYGEMTGDNIYEDIHSMARMNSQVLGKHGDR